MNFMSSLKAAWHTDRIEQLRRGENITPTHLHLILSDLCNQNCNFCSYRADNGYSTELFWEGENRNPNRFLPTEKAIEILEDYSTLGGLAVQFQGGGEPTVHEDHLAIIEYAQMLGLQTGLITNGVRLRDHAAYRNLDFLRISLDAGTEETYEKIRESKAWPKVVDNLRIAGSFKKPKVGTGFVVTRENYLEIAEAALLTKDSGIEYMRVSAMLSHEGMAYYHGIDVEIPDFDWIVNLFSDHEDGPPDYEFCGYQQFTLYIGADQQVYTCCANAYTSHGRLASLENGTFRDFLLNYDRRPFDARSCHHCQFSGQNRLIEYLMSEPEHVNFV